MLTLSEAIDDVGLSEVHDTRLRQCASLCRKRPCGCKIPTGTWSI